MSPTLDTRTPIKTEARALWQLAWPMLIGQLANVGMSVADVAMSGHASAQDLAAVSLGTSVWTILLVTLMGVMMAVNPIVAHYVGAGEYGRIPHVVRQALWKALGIGLLAMVVANIATMVFDHMQIEPVVAEMAKQFLHVISFALPAFACYRVLYGYSASLSQTKPMMVIALAALALNVLLNWVLIYGKFGFPELGGVGCAYATLACVWFNLLALIWWMRRAPAYRNSWPLSHFEAPHWPEIRNLLKIGLPIGVTYFAESSAFGLIALLVAEFGTAQVAAHQIALNFSSLVFMVPLSLGVAVLTRVGQALGEGDPAAARFRSWVGVGLSFGFAIISACFIALFNQQIAALYTSDINVAALAAHLLIFAAVFQLSDATQVSTSCAIRGYKVTKPPMMIHLAAFWGFSLPLGCILGLSPVWFPWKPSQPMAAEGFWIALVVGLTIAALGLTWFLDRLSRGRLSLAT
ncbi:MATE family efflux transporter [Chitinimonas sp. BJB300]|uniref:MATE family efflux transporter n=1 Tax=Chitinimonas sp. BJB300 TaxID=1559339 RepID=UPI000C0E4F4D|nr:MATE family efflux transporter [Chitinimonas sp. BJB300]PHV10958.1 MATE family efflux transporter [Chitinimonas sp. BJB300]TSJ89893.1 MATE family efflux transporter [Chitinimonas sp. BJB300]